MIKLLLLTAAFIVTTFPAAAQNREAVCRVLPVKGQFDGVDYVPGVDVHGNPVVPADINASRAAGPDVIRFPVTVDLAQQLNLPLPQGTEMQAPVALVEIHKDGRVVYNGENFGPEIYTLCGKEPLNYKEETAEEPAPSVPPATEPPVSAAVPEPKPETAEDIIWGEGY